MAKKSSKKKQLSPDAERDQFIKEVLKPVEHFQAALAALDEPASVSPAVGRLSPEAKAALALARKRRRESKK